MRRDQGSDQVTSKLSHSYRESDQMNRYPSSDPVTSYLEEKLTSEQAVRVWNLVARGWNAFAGNWNEVAREWNAIAIAWNIVAMPYNILAIASSLLI